MNATIESMDKYALILGKLLDSAYGKTKKNADIKADAAKSVSKKEELEAKRKIDEKENARPLMNESMTCLFSVGMNLHSTLPTGSNTSDEAAHSAPRM
jgi:hypothetical protein